MPFGLNATRWDGKHKDPSPHLPRIGGQVHPGQMLVQAHDSLIGTSPRHEQPYLDTASHGVQECAPSAVIQTDHDEVDMDLLRLDPCRRGDTGEEVGAHTPVVALEIRECCIECHGGMDLLVVQTEVARLTLAIVRGRGRPRGAEGGGMRRTRLARVRGDIGWILTHRTRAHGPAQEEEMGHHKNTHIHGACAARDARGASRGLKCRVH